MLDKISLLGFCTNVWQKNNESHNCIKLINVMPNLNRHVLIILIFSLPIACKTKVETKEWNLNQTIGWKSDNPDDFAVLFLRLKRLSANSRQIADKRKFDEAVLQELRMRSIGVRAENDEPSEIDFHFVVSKDYQKAIAAILSVAKTYNMEQQITVYKRDYQAYDKWTDKVVYPN
jgi:hypothetical protein